jgi:hypothetical protein
MGVQGPRYGQSQFNLIASDDDFERSSISNLQPLQSSSAHFLSNITVASPFTYGPLAYFLKSRIYVGEMHHAGKWFKGEHQAILDRPTFEQVQALLASNRITRRIRHSESGALLRGKLFDDKATR